VYVHLTTNEIFNISTCYALVAKTKYQFILFDYTERYNIMYCR